MRLAFLVLLSCWAHFSRSVNGLVRDDNGDILQHELGTSTSTSSKKVIRIGAAIPMLVSLTGDVDNLGIQRIAAFLVAIKDLNSELASQGYVVKFALRDSKRTFTNAIRAGLDLTKKVFNGTGIHGAIGAGLNTETEGMAFITQDYDVAQVAYASDLSDLSHELTYPDFLRVYPSSSYQAVALAQLVKNTFGWTRVVVAFTADTYGIDAYAEFKVQARDLKIDIVFAISVTPGLDEDFSAQIENIRKRDVRIFVFLLSNVQYANNLLKQGSAGDVFNERTVVLGTTVMSTEVLWKTLYSIYTTKGHNVTQTFEVDRIRKFMNGFIGLRVADNDWKVTSAGRTFIKKFRALPASIYYDSHGHEVCDFSKDDDGGFYLYRAINETGQYVCTGQVFSKYSANGFNVTNFAAYIYDATYALVKGIVAYNELLNDGGPLPLHISGLALKEVMISQNLSFNGVSGRVAFSSGRPYMANYGRGDRTIGVRYAVVNFNSENDSLAGFHLKRIGTWRSEGGYQSCADDTQLASYLTGFCTELSWGSNGKQMPADRAPPYVMQMPLDMRIVLYFLFSVLLLGVVGMGAVLHVYRNTQLLRASQTQMMWMILVAVLFGVVRILISAFDISFTSCTASFWFGHLTSLAIIVLFVKTLRVELIVTSKLLKYKFSTMQGLQMALAILSVLLVLMVILTAVNPQFATEVVEESQTGQLVHIISCATLSLRLEYALYALEGLVLLANAKLCYDTQNVPDIVNESKYIAAIILITSITVCAAFVLVFLGGFYPHVNQFIVGIGFAVCMFAFIFLYFLPKAYLLLTGADLDRKKLAIVRKKTPKANTAAGQQGNGNGNPSGSGPERQPSNNEVSTFYRCIPSSCMDAGKSVRVPIGNRMTRLPGHRRSGSGSAGSKCEADDEEEEVAAASLPPLPSGILMRRQPETPEECEHAIDAMKGMVLSFGTDMMRSSNGGHLGNTMGMASPQRHIGVHSGSAGSNNNGSINTGVRRLNYAGVGSSQFANASPHAGPGSATPQTVSTRRVELNSTRGRPGGPGGDVAASVRMPPAVAEEDEERENATSRAGDKSPEPSNRHMSFVTPAVRAMLNYFTARKVDPQSGTMRTNGTGARAASAPRGGSADNRLSVRVSPNNNAAGSNSGSNRNINNNNKGSSGNRPRSRSHGSSGRAKSTPSFMEPAGTSSRIHLPDDGVDSGGIGAVSLRRCEPVSTRRAMSNASSGSSIGVGAMLQAVHPDSVIPSKSGSNPPTHRWPSPTGTGRVVNANSNPPTYRWPSPNATGRAAGRSVNRPAGAGSPPNPNGDAGTKALQQGDVVVGRRSSKTMDLILHKGSGHNILPVRSNDTPVTVTSPSPASIKPSRLVEGIGKVAAVELMDILQDRGGGGGGGLPMDPSRRAINGTGTGTAGATAETADARSVRFVK